MACRSYAAKVWPCLCRLLFVALEILGVHVETSDVISLSAAIIALCALAISIWQGYITRNHQKLTVKPHIDFDYKFFPGKPIELRIMNNGLGPAVITSFNVLFDGKKISNSHSESYIKITDKLKDDTGFDLTFEYNFPLKNEAFPAGSIEYLLKVTLKDKNDADAMEAAKNILSRVGFSADYECMYGIKYQRKLPQLFSNN